MNKYYETYDLEESLKSKSYPYYFCFLTLPRQFQDTLALFWGIAAEIRFIPLNVTNPLMGFMRLTSWRDRLVVWEMEDKIDWLNTYEVFFDETINIQTNWPTYIQGETLLIQHSLSILEKNSSPSLINAATLLGEVLGLIYLLQSDRKFDFEDDLFFKKSLVHQIETRLTQLTLETKIPKNCHSLFSLMGYCFAWLNRYRRSHHPVTVTEFVIQWAILKQRIRISWNFYFKN